jgi:hypothetical protein
MRIFPPAWAVTVANTRRETRTFCHNDGSYPVNDWRKRTADSNYSAGRLEAR